MVQDLEKISSKQNLSSIFDEIKDLTNSFGQQQFAQTEYKNCKVMYCIFIC